MSPAKRPSRSSGREDAVPARIEGLLDGRGMRFAIVLSRFNDVVGERLLAGALDCLARHGAGESTVARVPGSWEIPLAARALARSGRYDGIVALGALIRGETSHFDVLAAEVAKGLAQVGLETGLPIGFGVLTTDTLEQALERAGAKAGNKGSDAALAALEMVSLLRQLA